MAEKDAPAPKKTAAKKSAAKKSTFSKAEAKATASSKSSASKKSEHVTVEDMHKLLAILQDGLSSRDKAMDYLVTEIKLNQVQIEQNKKILAKRGFVNKLVFVLLAIGLIIVGKDQYTIVKSFDEDMTIVAQDMNVMMAEMTSMRIAMENMSLDIHSMSVDFSMVAKDVSSIALDVRSISYGVSGMSYDTYEMNRSMEGMTPPWSPFR